MEPVRAEALMEEILNNAGSNHTPFSLNGFIITGLVWGLWSHAFAGIDQQDVGKSFKGLKFSVTAYVDYSDGNAPLPDGADERYSEFKNTRGYLTVKKEIKSWLSVRVTLDAHMDSTGDYKARHKYLYAEFSHRGVGFFTHLKSEFGVGHMPWLDFEEHINPYRCQGTMAVERAGTFNAADGGISLRGYFGGRLQDARERLGNTHYDGKWGSWHVGLYNGSGYHASEENTDKTFQARITARPMPKLMPGLQLSFLNVSGKGNVAKNAFGILPGYQVNMAMLSFENPTVTATIQSWKTDGNARGTWVNPQGEALATEGFSGFANVKLRPISEDLSLWGRFDHFDGDPDGVYGEDAQYDLSIAGMSYDFHRGNLLMLVYESTDYGKDSGGKGKLPSTDLRLGDDNKIQLVWQAKH